MVLLGAGEIRRVRGGRDEGVNTGLIQLIRQDLLQNYVYESRETSYNGTSKISLLSSLEHHDLFDLLIKRFCVVFCIPCPFRQLEGGKSDVGCVLSYMFLKSFRNIWCLIS